MSAVARSFLIVRIISDGFADASKTTVAPSSGGTNSVINWPKTWLNGRAKQAQWMKPTLVLPIRIDALLKRLEVRQEISMGKHHAARLARRPEV